MAENKMVIELLVRDEVTKQLNKLDKQSKKTSTSVKKNFTDMAVKVAAFGFAVKKAADLFNVFVKAASKVENLKVRLQLLLGDVKEANKLFASMRDLVATAPVGFEDVMESVTNLTAVVKGGAEEVQQLIPIILDISAATGKSVVDTTSQMIRAYSAGIAAADAWRESGVRSALGFKDGVSVSAEETMNQIIAQWEDGSGKFVGAIDGLRDTWIGKVEEMGDAWFNLTVSLGEFITESEDVHAAIKILAEGFDRLTFHIESSQAAGKGLLQTYIEMVNPMNVVADIFADFVIAQEAATQGMISGNLESIDSLELLMEKTQELSDNTEKAATKMTKDMEKSAKIIELKLRNAFANPLADFISGTKTAKEAVTDLGKSMIKIIADYLAQVIISKTIGSAIQKAAVAASVVDASILAAAWEPAAVFAAIATGGGAAAAGAAGVSSAFVTSSLVAKAASIPQLAEGGIVSRPTMALIGEAGPEAVVPLSGGGGFGDINITINGGIDSGGLGIEEMAEKLGIEFEREVRTAKG